MNVHVIPLLRNLRFFAAQEWVRMPKSGWTYTRFLSSLNWNTFTTLGAKWKINNSDFEVCHHCGICMSEEWKTYWHKTLQNLQTGSATSETASKKKVNHCKLKFQVAIPNIFWVTISRQLLQTMTCQPLDQLIDYNFVVNHCKLRGRPYELYSLMVVTSHNRQWPRISKLLLLEEMCSCFTCHEKWHRSNEYVRVHERVFWTVEV